ncbi:hypothetical protein JYU34_016810 [Plutella xylostella]|uniref:Cuticular protein n=1 Tax=Plutella xylostella TaxID=51655 RepID=A0ABQ7Q3I7_PLUXY|nr:hypothetical protein JYU34_016810 [Plutella xylostella]
MTWKVLLLAAVWACAAAHGPAVSEQHFERHYHPVQRGHHGQLGHIGEHEQKHHEEYAWSYPSYEYSYMVHDPHTGDHKGQAEMRKGDEVKGEYWLMEPTGNKRTVKYHADHTGFHAEVHNSHPHIHEMPKEEEKHEEKHEEEKHEEEHKPEEHHEPEVHEPEVKEEEPIHHPIYKTIVHQEIYHPYHYKHEEEHKHEEMHHKHEEMHRPVKMFEEIIHHKVHHKEEEHKPEVHHMKPIIIKPIHVPREPLVHYEPRPVHYHHHEQPKVEDHEHELPLLSIYKPRYEHHRDHHEHQHHHENEDYGWIRGPHARHHRDAKRQRKFKVEDLNA